MRSSLAILAALTFPQMACARDDGQAEKAEAVAQVSEEEIFQAAGFSLAKGIWQKCGEPGTISYEPGTISQRGDFNGDDLLDALVTEGGTYCFGMTGSGYTLVSRGADGGWRILDERIGIAIFLEKRGVEGWPDIQVGEPWFCFPIMRWNGSEYAFNRTKYEGAPC